MFAVLSFYPVIYIARFTFLCIKFDLIRDEIERTAGCVAAAQDAQKK